MSTEDPGISSPENRADEKNTVTFLFQKSLIQSSIMLNRLNTLNYCMYHVKYLYAYNDKLSILYQIIEKVIETKHKNTFCNISTCLCCIM